MNHLHERTKSHHHVAVWAIVVLTTVFAATVNTTNVITVSAEQDGSADVSDKTKKFFNFEEGDGSFIEPAACKEPSVEQEALVTKNETLNQELQGLSNIDTSSYTNEQITDHQAKITALQTELENLSSSFSEQVFGPSDACKLAIVGQMVTQMSAMNSQMESKLFATLDRVTATVAKVKTIIAKVAETSDNKETLSKVNNSISSIELNVGVLRAFFKVMQKEMTDFLALAKASPTKAFDGMMSFGSGNDDNKAATAADQLVNSFESLEINVASLVTLEGAN